MKMCKSCKLDKSGTINGESICSYCKKQAYSAPENERLRELVDILKAEQFKFITDNADLAKHNGDIVEENIQLKAELKVSQATLRLACEKLDFFAPRSPLSYNGIDEQLPRKWIDYFTHKAQEAV